MTAYLTAQTILFVLFSMLFMAAHRRLLVTASYRRWLENAGSSSGQWLFVFPIAACVYAVPAGLLFATAGRQLGQLVPAAIGAAVCLVAKNLVYAAIPRRPLLEAWDGAAFVLMVVFIGSWFFAAGALGLQLWTEWFGVNTVLAVAVIAISARVFTIPPPLSAPPQSMKKSKGSEKRP